VICWGTMIASQHYLGTDSLAARLVNVLLPMSLGTVAFIGLAALLKMDELRSASRLIRRRFSGRGVPQPDEDIQASDGM